MADSKKNETDPTQDLGFKRVVDHFLNTLPKPHKDKVDKALYSHPDVIEAAAFARP